MSGTFAAAILRSGSLHNQQGYRRVRVPSNGLMSVVNFILDEARQRVARFARTQLTY